MPFLLADHSTGKILLGNVRNRRQHVRTICIGPDAGIVTYRGNELQELAGQRNVAAEQLLNRQLPGAPFFGNISSQQCEGVGRCC